MLCRMFGCIVGWVLGLLAVPVIIFLFLLVAAAVFEVAGAVLF